MRWTYDGGSDSLYVYVSEDAITEQRELADGTIVDVAQDGSLVGFEVLAMLTGWTPEQIAGEFGLSPGAKDLLTLLVHSLVGTSAAEQPRTRLASSAAPMPALTPA